ncbi:hypothetical protein JK386_03040 [Nocardioides sp. zg-536]|uniref:Uncharacterized protein n=1 Tax=Nocardioides faecalis TaxID=2803858 RepID=A0A939BWZ7_9ACTN|nr:hypothetical protein [Nocardioides faecalis]MBM9458863.1 hypothetical protein [Nocardioides faecalis]QVI60269.1 hypothetical protein KG111_08300 [Nocardioides faecalis]
MSDAEIWVALGVAVLSAFWTSGGRAALQRRVIQHELELASQLYDGMLKKKMRQSAEDRAAVYLARGLPSDDSLGVLGRILAPVAAGALLLSGLSAINEPLVISAGVGLLAVALVGGGFGAMLDALYRDGRAWMGKVRSNQAWKRLRSADQSRR